MQWKRIMELALAITVAAGAAVGVALWDEWRVAQDFHKAWMLLTRARARAMEGGTGPVTVRFNSPKAIVEDRRGVVIESLDLPTLNEVRFTTTQGTRMIVFTGGGGQTSPYNIHLHGGDFTFQAWTGYSRSIWIHCSGGMSEGRNDDWTLNPTTPSAVRF